MANKRLARLNEQMKREISEIVRRDVRDPRIGPVTVTRVDVSGDLWLAKVYVRCVGDDAERAESMSGLEAAAPFIRRTLGSALHIRRVPEVRFVEDRALDHAMRIEAILKDVAPGPEASPQAEGSESGSPPRGFGRPGMNPPTPAGILRVDKPAGPTSHDMVARCRRALGIRRIGHTGTLDPFATGLLLLCVGQATRLSEYLTGLDKSYEATAMLGQSTDTDDLEGEVVRVSERWRDLSVTDVEAALATFTGDIQQVPPAFSAKKVDGERMYRRARRGEQVALQPVSVIVFEAGITAVDLPLVRFTLRCSSGTYVRAVARDLGEALGCGAHLTELRRTRVGAFDVAEAVSGDSLNDEEAVRAAWVEPAKALIHLPRIEVDDAHAAGFVHGQPVPAGDVDVPESKPVAVLHHGRLLGVATRTGDRIRPRKVLSLG